MMSTDLLMLRTYFGFTSIVNPDKAARKSFKMFQKVRKKKTRDREELFFDMARKFLVPFENEPLACFEMGNSNGDLVLLVHGWDSNAGSMSKLAFNLAERGKRVIAFNLPGHADYKSSYTNLVECKNAVHHVLDYLNPQQPISIVSHSFGSAVVSYALSKTTYNIDKLVFLTNPNRIDKIFTDFKNVIGLGDIAFNKLLKISEEKLGESLDSLNIEDNLKKIKYEKLLLIHDIHDKALGYHNSFEINSEIQNCQLITFEHIGHYKMLWNNEVIGRTIAFIEGEEVL